MWRFVMNDNYHQWWGSIRLVRLSSPQVSRCVATCGRCFAGCWYAVGNGCYQLLNPLENLLALFYGWLRYRYCFRHGLSQVLLSVRKH
jgi:hypothetical protein